MSTWITTHTGRNVDLLNPTSDQIDIRDIAHALSLLCRFNGHTLAFYSVAQHSVLVSRWLPPELQLQGLLHDAHEAYIGDWSTPLKNSLSPSMNEQLQRFERRLIDCIGESLGVRLIRHPRIKEADKWALAAEARSLMAGPISCLPEGIDPPSGELRPWRARYAEAVFLSEFARLSRSEVQREWSTVDPATIKSDRAIAGGQAIQSGDGNRPGPMGARPGALAGQEACVIRIDP